MTDQTVLKPRPGGRKPAKQAAEFHAEPPSEPNKDKTRLAAATPSQQATAQRQPSLLISDNPLIEEAGDLFSLIGPIRSTASHPDVMGLKGHCIELIQQYEQRLKLRGIGADEIRNARYCLCSFIDESVLNTNWGSDSDWASFSLLSNFYQETFGGAYFFTLLDNALMDPKTHIQLIELMYLCLSFGFVGKMRIAEQGYEQLNAIKDRVYKAIKSERGEPPRELAPDWQSSVLVVDRSHESFPLWVICSVVAALLLCGYLYLSYLINERSDHVNRELVALVQLPEQSDVITATNSAVTQETRRLSQLLQTEINRNLIEIIELPDRVTIRVGNDQLFSSGSTSITEGFLPVVHKIARSLEGADGRILVNGYTDDLPIFSSRYPSNWHLSLARANSMADALAAGADLRGRLWPEGRGDVDPLVPNDTAENRARNRRVEIDLLPN
ncbi:type VI secretion system protein TssL, long form [Alkalimonas collagenimarina]|uniref:Type VI secretion system protein TssL, long form n=1 Tax=Alkalimonas collagenimarina TaxID=400390 RepID=A0ABT9H2X8_9GAMM|nr:type VI secretion system protein TssL, long form [Alkalimonas collagenimarina]MDP4537674.1 type VI secretion system protein TssL, long form [Alkalimonas collagenimarina]